jgi:hypothetical protein
MVPSRNQYNKHMRPKRSYVAICLKIMDNDGYLHLAPYNIIDRFRIEVKHTTIINKVGWNVTLSPPPGLEYLENSNTSMEFTDYSARLFVKGWQNETKEELRQYVGNILSNMVRDTLYRLDMNPHDKPNFEYYFDEHRDCFIWAKHLPLGVDCSFVNN